MFPSFSLSTFASTIEMRLITTMKHITGQIASCQKMMILYPPQRNSQLTMAINILLKRNWMRFVPSFVQTVHWRTCVLKTGDLRVMNQRRSDAFVLYFRPCCILFND